MVERLLGLGSGGRRGFRKRLGCGCGCGGRGSGRSVFVVGIVVVVVVVVAAAAAAEVFGSAGHGGRVGGGERREGGRKEGKVRGNGAIHESLFGSESVSVQTGFVAHLASSGLSNLLGAQVLFSSDSFWMKGPHFFF